MKTESDVRDFRRTYLKLANEADVSPELIRRYKFAVNFCDYILGQPTTFVAQKHFHVPNEWPQSPTPKVKKDEP